MLDQDQSFTIRPIPRVVIRADGSKDSIPHGTLDDYARHVGAGMFLDVVRLRHLGDNPVYVMLVDDMGHDKKLPVNEEATKLYHANCQPGTTHTIRGDVVVVPDADFQNY